MTLRLLVDGREFVSGRRTGIGRFLEGLLTAIVELRPEWRITLAVHDPGVVPEALADHVTLHTLSRHPEFCWSNWSREADLFLSPYPKLPLFKLHCPAVHTVHDVLYLDHPAYRGRAAKRFAGRMRLNMALARADLTWFDSKASEEACRRLTGHTGRHPEVRYPAIDAAFLPHDAPAASDSPRFLYVGNGLPHKNIPVILKAIASIDARLCCIGVSDVHAKVLLQAVPEAEGRVEFRRNVEDAALREAYRSSVALLQPSTAEGYGYPPLEAMACGTPAIISDIPVLIETTGGVATVCPAHDTDAWGEAMRRMFGAGERQVRSQAGLAFAGKLRAPDGWLSHIGDLERLAGGAGCEGVS